MRSLKSQAGLCRTGMKVNYVNVLDRIIARSSFELDNTTRTDWHYSCISKPFQGTGKFIFLMCCIRCALPFAIDDISDPLTV